MNSKTDAELITAYVDSGDEAAFAEIVSRHGALVYRVCHGFVNDRHEAEDCSQAVFLVLVRKASTLGKRPNLTSWLYGVAKRVSLRALEKRKNRAKREERVVMEQQDDQELTPEEQAAVMANLYQELDGLSALQKQAVLLRYFEGHSEKQAAMIAGCSPSALGTRASDGIARLRKRLGRRGAAVSLTALLGLLATEAQAAGPATLLPSLLAVLQGAAVGAAAGAAGTVGASACALAEGVIKMMMWSKVKMVSAVVAGAVILSTATPLLVTSLSGERDSKVDDANIAMPRDDNTVRPKPVAKKKTAARIRKMADKKLYTKATVVVRCRPVGKPSVYHKTAQLTVEVLEVIKKPKDWDKYSEIVNWERVNDRNAQRNAPPAPLKLQLRFAKMGDEKLPKRGEMTVYLETGTEQWDDGSEVKNLKPLGGKIKTAISHVVADKNE